MFARVKIYLNLNKIKIEVIYLHKTMKYCTESLFGAALVGVGGIGFALSASAIGIMSLSAILPIAGIGILVGIGIKLAIIIHLFYNKLAIY